jgi:hypothetical protein
MLTHHIALVDQTKTIEPGLMAQTATALQTQAVRDLEPIWKTAATVNYFPDIKHVPAGYWPIIIMKKLSDPTAGGYHTDKNHQPFALILHDDSWQLSSSHEMCEMLVDPYGNKLHAAPSIEKDQSDVQYLVEVCDPCEDASFGYDINGIKVSDFYTPHFFDPTGSGGVRYSFTGSIKKPLTVEKNGYISWYNPADQKWYQATFFGTTISIRELTGMEKSQGSLRSRVDRLTKSPSGLGSVKATSLHLHLHVEKHWNEELKFAS